MVEVHSRKSDKQILDDKERDSEKNSSESNSEDDKMNELFG